jgi:protein phosphatase
MHVTLIRNKKRSSRPITEKDPPVSWAASQTGPREQNEDDYGRADQDTRDYDWVNRGCLYLLADGMGGLDAGKEAAQAAVRHVIQEYRNIGRSQDVVQNLTQAMQNANQHLYKAGTRSGKRMGSTMVACVLKDGKATVAHAGDSRAYHLADGELHRLTRDHLYATEVQGIKDDDEAKRSPEGHKITRALGKDPELNVDTKEEEYRPGDRFLLCSDGISEVLSKEEIGECLRQKTPEKAVRALCSVAEGRLNDNATAVVVFASGKKIRRNKQWKRLAYASAAVVLLGGVSAGAYEGWTIWQAHQKPASSALVDPNKPKPSVTSEPAESKPDKPSAAVYEAESQSAKAHAEEAKSKADEAKANAAARVKAAAMRVQAAKSKAGEQHSAELAKADAELAKAQAEAAKADARAVRAEAEAAKVKAESHEAAVKAQAEAAKEKENAAKAKAAEAAAKAQADAANEQAAKATAEAAKAEAEKKGRDLTVRNSTDRPIEFWWVNGKKENCKVKTGETVKHHYPDLRDVPSQIYWRYQRGFLGHFKNDERDKTVPVAQKNEIVINDQDAKREQVEH